MRMNPHTPPALITGHLFACSAEEVKQCFTVNRFFHSDGFLCDSALRPVVEKLLAEYEALAPSSASSGVVAADSKKTL